MMWIVATVEQRRITRIVIGCEIEARRIHALLLPDVGKQYLAVSLQTAMEEPMRSDEERQRAEQVVRALSTKT